MAYQMAYHQWLIQIAYQMAYHCAYHHHFLSILAQSQWLTGSPFPPKGAFGVESSHGGHHNFLPMLSSYFMVI